MKRLMVAVIATFAASAASAGLITATLEGNDCSGVFGQGFENCTINGSPIIVKYEFDDFPELDDVEINSIFPTIDGSEFSGDSLDGGLTGTWEYDQGAGDPDVRYWVAKGGPFFTLHYLIDDALGLDAACNADALSQACLDLALVTTSGDWGTPINPANGRPYGLSHLSFYDTLGVPAPAPLALLGLGLVALAFRRRRMA